MKSFEEYLNESVLRYTWDGVTEDDIESYAKKNNLKLTRDPQHKEYIIATKNGKLVFRYDEDEYELYSDYTIIELEDGRIK